jgi:1,2-diacylglycerol 3-alpha-glucosyltransferase
MRILIATSSDYRAFHGQAIFTKNLAEGLVRHGHEVLVVAASRRGEHYEAVFNGVQVHALRSISLKSLNPNAITAIFTGKAMRRIVASFRPDIIHIQDHYPLSRSALHAAKRSGIKIVGTNHFMPENLAAYIPLISKVKPLYNWILWHWMRFTFDHLDGIAAPSRIAAEILRKNSVNPPVQPISCGANTLIFHPIPEVDRSEWRKRYDIDLDKKIFFFVGRVDREKRLDMILRAATKLNRDDFQIVIAGNGANARYLQGLARELGLSHRVLFTGFLPDDDLPSVLNSIDVFIMPSEAELLSIATIQAMACSRPVLAADAVALPELVVNNENGLLFRSGDIEDAARGMTWFLDHPERWSEMGAASLKRSQNHALDHIVSQYEQFYRSVLA